MPLYPALVIPQAWQIGTETVEGSAASGVLGANIVYLYVFELLVATSFSGIRLDIGATATGTSDVALYDSGGNIITATHVGATANVANGVQTFAFAATVTLSPGRYILAMTPSNSTDTIFRKTTIASGMARCYTATNGGTAGVLPSTTGTLVASATMPAMNLVVVGGAP